MPYIYRLSGLACLHLREIEQQALIAGIEYILQYTMFPELLVLKRRK